MLLALLLALATAEAPPVVADVVFEGADAAAVLPLVDVHKGEPLDARDVRDSVRALHASARFARVAAFTEPAGPGAVRVVFALTPVEKLLAVGFPGRKALAESVLHQTANLQVNAEVQPEQLASAVEAVRAAYFRIGYRHAQVTPVRRQSPAGITLDLQIDEGPATRVTGVRFDGDAGLSQEELAAAFRLARGDVLTTAALDDGARGVRDRYRRAGRLRARVDAPRVEESADARALVIVPVNAGPLVRFHLRGNRAFPDGVLAAQLKLDSEEALDAQATQDMAARLRRFYVTAGFLRARVAARELEGSDGAVEVVFTIDEDQPVLVDDLRFEGNAGIATAQLRERLLLVLRDNVPPDPAGGADPAASERMGLMGRVPDPHPARTLVNPDTVFDPVLYARALKQMEDLYKSQGYLSARAGPPRPEPIGGDPHHLRVTIPIKEGGQTLVSRVVTEGGGDAPAAELDAAIVLRPGQPFSYLAAEEGRNALTGVFTRRGHLYAKVEDEEQFEEVEEGKASRVEVRYRIQPGPVVRVGFVEVVGERRTLEGLILDLVGLKPGDVITPEELDRAQQALLRTGLFYSATLTPRNPEVAEAEKTVQVQLRERPVRDIQASLGFSLADGPRASAQWTQANLLGRNLTFSAVAKADFPFGRFYQLRCDGTGQNCAQVLTLPPGVPIERVIDFGLSTPRLWPWTDKLRASFDLIHQRAIQPSYDLTKYSAQASVELVQRRPVSAGIVYEFGEQQLQRGALSVDDVIALLGNKIFRLPPGQMLFGSLRPFVTFDLRDDAARPRSGLLVQLSGDYLRSYAGSDTQVSELPRINVNLMKMQGLVAGYVPLPFLSSLVLSARGGRIFQLDSVSKTPGDRSFYLGGATSLRGFHEDAVEPADVVNLLKAQVQACANTLTNVACSAQTQLLASGTVSAGGDQFVGLGAELRVPFATSAEMAFFYDAGNLWAQPFKLLPLNHIPLRSAVGIGLRWLTPIGRFAIDLGMNLNPDPLLGEPRFGPYFSIDPL